jgi:nitrate reductase alpha subunit
MTSTCTYSDIVLPAATWYEKHDISTTDMHSFNPAIAPPRETRTDFEAFALIAEQFSRLAATHLGTRTDVLAAPLLHDTPDEMAQPGGVVRDWKRGECEPVPGVTMPRLAVIERDYGAVAQKMAALGPLVDTLGTGVKGVTWEPAAAVDLLGRTNGRVRGGVGDGRPSLARDVHLAEAILALSGTTNGQVAVQGWRELERRTGVWCSTSPRSPRAGNACCARTGPTSNCCGAASSRRPPPTSMSPPPYALCCPDWDAARPHSCMPRGRPARHARRSDWSRSPRRSI